MNCLGRLIGGERVNMYGGGSESRVKGAGVVAVMGDTVIGMFQN